MLVFIDESGCSGFKLDRGSNAVFAIGMVMFADPEAAQETERCIQGIRRATGHKPEFRFSKCSDRVRDAFFAGVARCPFKVRALVVEKDRVYSPKLRSDDDAFYNFFVRQLMQHDGGRLQDAKVRLDGSGDREFQRALKAYLRRELPPGRVADLRMVDSERDLLAQLADMCIGAVARAYRPGRENGRRWLDMLRPRIDNVWPFR